MWHSWSSCGESGIPDHSPIEMSFHLIHLMRFGSFTTSGCITGGHGDITQGKNVHASALRATSGLKIESCVSNETAVKVPSGLRRVEGREWRRQSRNGQYGNHAALQHGRRYFENYSKQTDALLLAGLHSRRNISATVAQQFKLAPAPYHLGRRRRLARVVLTSALQRPVDSASSTRLSSLG